MNGNNPKVDWYFHKAEKWQEEVNKLRTIILDCELTEELKWGNPCYTLGKSNIVLIHSFKEYCALLFMKGALMKDAKGILIQQTENVQSARQIRFTSVEEIAKMQSIIKAYVEDAIEVKKSGLEVEFKKTKEFAIPEEFQNKLEELPALQAAFGALTAGRQRAYILHFAGAKQSQTRASRVEKYIPRILDGLGLKD